MTTTLVTGLAGFVGSWVASEVPDAADLVDARGRVDIGDAQRVRDAVARLRPTSVIHLAAQSSVPVAFADPLGTYRTNFLGTLHLFEALAAAGFRGRVLYVSSAEVYGSVAPERFPVPEDTPFAPRNPYAVAKIASEALCRQWSLTGPFEIVVARPFNHIGPRQNPNFAIPDFARQVVAFRRGRGPGALKVGDLDRTRDFTDVRDIVRAYLALLVHGENGEAYNVCSGIERDMRDVVRLLLDIAGVDMRLEVDAQRHVATQQSRMRGSPAKLHERTGWTPRIPLERTLADVLDHWERQDTASA
ncbi:GDP-mannose 4,6-dehydratase [Ramlibacter sp.]|uniref:GDP-mannose 4,6-dehydratase n=1 Tax=Ramlibacter sp. TaxID=1917967 RepID=UPI003D13B6B2